MPRLAALVLTATLAALAVPGLAKADGDPASDWLYTQRVFFPYTVKTSKSAQDLLTTTIEKAERAGYPIRVALIAGPADLGAVTALWGKPEEYARFLDLELAFIYKRPLLIVMPAGAGFAYYKHTTTKEEHTVASLPVESGGDGLAYTAARAVGALARQAGHPIALPVIPRTSAVPRTGSSSGLGNRFLAGGVVLVFAAVSLGVVWLLRRELVHR